MINIKYGIPLRQFGHQFIINKLKASDLIKDKTAEDISEGFCYILALDWLFNHTEAEQNYFDTNITVNEANQVASKNMLNYFAQLAKIFSDYKKHMITYQDKQIYLCGYNNVIYTDISPQYLLDTDNYFAKKHYQTSFTYWNSFIMLNDFEETLLNQKDKESSVDMLLFRLIFKEGTQIWKHTIAMQKVINQEEGVSYIFFDPTFGVYKAKSYDNIKDKCDGFAPILFFNMLMQKYKTKYKREFVSAYFSYLSKNHLVIGR